MGLRFIFMLTRRDRTVEDASIHVQSGLQVGVRHIGFKDIGLPMGELHELSRTIKNAGATSYLEVVSLNREGEIASAKAAAEIGVDVLLGGTHIDYVLPILKGTRVQYCPFLGNVSGHPSILEGTTEEIVASAKAMVSQAGVDGLDLLAYRSKTEHVPSLIKAVCSAVDRPIYVAGSIDTPEKIADVKEGGAAGFTIGTAALDGRYPAADRDVPTQLAAIILDVARLNRHLSPYHKKSLATALGTPPDACPFRLTGHTNQIDIKLIRLIETPAWHFHKDADELCFVHKGRLLMRLRDRDEILQEGEFIVVPQGVEHCPVALDTATEVVLLQSA